MPYYKVVRKHIVETVKNQVRALNEDGALKKANEDEYWKTSHYTTVEITDLTNVCEKCGKGGKVKTL